MGALQADLPFVPVLIGLAGLFSGLLFATARGAADGGWMIIALGLVFAAVWTGFLRVGSQLALFLAPIATFLLLLGLACRRSPTPVDCGLKPSAQRSRFSSH